MRYHECPRDLAKRLITLAELCVGDCFWRRRLVRLWSEVGLDAAYADWLADAPKRVPEFLPQVATLIEEIKKCPSKP